MGKLDEAIIYTSGAMEFAADHGVEWRRKFIHQVWDAGLTTIDIIDPTDKPGPPEFKVGEEKDFQTALQQEGRYEELRQYVGQYRRYDLRCCDYMDALVACIDPTIPHWGYTWLRRHTSPASVSSTVACPVYLAGSSTCFPWKTSFRLSRIVYNIS